MKRRTLWIIALISIISTLLIVGCNANDVNCEEADFYNEEYQPIKNTPDEVLKVNQLMGMSDQYDLIYTGNSILVYKAEKIIDEVEIGNATYCGFSNKGNHYFLAGNSVKKVTYCNSEIDVDTISDNVKRIVDTNFHYNKNDKSALLVETIEGQYKVWTIENKWVELK